MFRGVVGAPEGRGPAWATWPATGKGRVIAVVCWTVVLAGAFTLALVSLWSFFRLGQGEAANTHVFDAVFSSLLLSVPLLAVGRSPLFTVRVMAIGLAWIVFCSGERPSWPWPPSALVLYAVVLVLAARAAPASGLPSLWVWTVAALWISGRGASTAAFVSLAAAAVLLLALGAAMRDRTEARQELAAASAARDAEAEELAVLAERARIARELHDAVAHHMAMISIQAQAAPMRTPDLPPPALEAFALIERAAREALSETRGIVGLLRGDPVEREPAPGLAGIRDLVDAAQANGVPVTLSMEPAPQPVPASTALAAYRMVQEGLANAVRHAPGALINVEVARQGGDLRIEITNGPAAAG
jgi:signal transduction histidine kinase